MGNEEETLGTVQEQVETKAKQILVLLEDEVGKEVEFAKTNLEQALIFLKVHFVRSDDAPRPATTVAADTTGSSDTATPAEPAAA